MMQRNLRILGALGLAGIVALVGAQVRAKAGSGQMLTASGQAIASPKNLANRSLSSVYWAAEALQRLIVTDANVHFRDAELAGKQDLMTKIVEVQCYAVLTTMTPAQQQNEKDNVWQVSQYKPGGQWDHVTSAPSMVKELTKVDPVVAQKIEKIWNDGMDRRVKPYMEMNHRIGDAMLAEGKWKQGTTEFNVEFNRRYQQMLADYQRGKSRAQFAQETLADLQDDMTRIKSLLTAVQVREWNAIESEYRAKIASVLAGGDPLHAKK